METSCLASVEGPPLLQVFRGANEGQMTQAEHIISQG